MTPLIKRNISTISGWPIGLKDLILTILLYHLQGVIGLFVDFAEFTFFTSFYMM
jgi:hypothetical protein